jgi:glycolate oxidase
MQTSQVLIEKLIDIAGEEQVLTGPDAASLYTDVYRKLSEPVAVVTPKSIEEVQSLVRLSAQYEFALDVRGGGASYTDGYLSAGEGHVLMDLRSLNRVVEINEVDGYVTVESGATWSSLKDALDLRGLRTPFWGPFSGLLATVGGSVSQNTISHGSGAYGISAESILSVDVVLADGSLLRTGSASTGGSPFCRHYGPDLTGLFTGDCGALGIKVSVTLPLIRKRPAHRTASFAFSDFADMHESMRLIAQEGLEDTHFSIDSALSQGQIARQDIAGNTWRMAYSIFASSPSWWSGLKQVVNAALTARSIIAKTAYMTHYIVEGVDDAEVKSRLYRIRNLVKGYGAEVPGTAPSLVRGMPFAPFYNTLGPRGERWVPLHGVMPHSSVKAFHSELEVLFAERKAEMDALGVWYGGMFATVGSSGFLYELALYWPDEISEYHRAVVPADYLAQLPVYPANQNARDYVHELKETLIQLYVKHGAINFQLGKAYPYRERLQEANAGLLATIKKHVDPDQRLSRGNLGL